LRWDPVVTHPDLAGYKIYYGNSSRNYDDTTDVGNQTSWTITDLIDTESYYFAVTAYDIYANESGYSNEVSVTFSDSSAVFVDVPSEHWAEDFIYTIYGAGITKGCSQNPLRYCPDKVVNRAIAAVLLLRSIHGGDYIPPPATGLFTDLPKWHWAAPWAEQLFREGITGGCSGNPQLYCPDRVVNRANAAVLLLRSIYGGDYIPPPATGLFTDLPRWHWAAPWAEQLSREGITGGCSGNPQLYCPDRVVNKAVAAVLWVRTFGL
jgi:hypothetical protein